MEQSVFDLQKLNEQLGVTDLNRSSSTDKGIIADDDIDKVSKIINSSDRKALNLEPEKTEEQSPEYLAEYKEILNTKLDLPEDTTDYSQRAIDEFGKDFAHLNSKDAFQDELYSREYKNEYFNRFDPKVVSLMKDIVEGRYDKGQLVRDGVATAMHKNESYTEEAFDERMKRYFDENGELNAEGIAKYNSYLSEYKTIWSKTNYDAERYASTELVKYKDMMNSVSNQLKTAKFGGIVLPEELSNYIEHNIKSGKTQDWLNNEPKNPEEAAIKEIQIALISDPRIFAEWFKLVTDLGVKHGVNIKAKQIFN